MKILSVDDNAENLYLIEVIARAHGHEVVTAHNGLEALEQLAGQDFDVIVSDVLMPGMDGFQLCRRVKDDDRLRHIPLIFYTATYTSEQDEELGLALGASRFLVKPVEPSKLLGIMEAVAREGPAGSTSIPAVDLDDGGKTLSLYNERLVRKLEQKVDQLEAARAELAASIKEKDREALQRRIAEEALRRSEEQLSLMWDASTDGMLLTGEDGVILRANPAFARLFGKPLESLCGQPFTCCIGEKADSMLARYRAQVESRTAETRFDSTLRRWDGEPMCVEVSNALIDVPAGPIVFTIFRDIEPRKRHEREQAALEDQLRQAQKLESVGRLAGGIAHDFNNLLTVINGYSELVSSELSPGDPLLGAVKEIHKAGQCAAALTRRILGFSRTQPFQPQMHDLSRVVAEARPMLDRMVGEDVVLKVHLHSKPAAIYADAHEIEQVLMNLVVNSRDALPRGGELRIETGVVEWGQDQVQAHAGAQPGPYALLSVVDNGEGMTPETYEHIFEPFFTTKEVGKGTGLGLSIVHKIVAQSKGFIDVRSAPGQGTAFSIYFPALDAPVAAAQEQAGARPLHGSETVLVVEDQLEVRKYVTAALRGYGYRVIPAAGAGEAERLFEVAQGQVDLLLTDVVMPDVSGTELADRMRKHGSKIRVLFMSGYAAEATMRHGLAIDAANFIQKPFSPDQLAGKVRETLSQPAGEVTPQP
jgi:two-component system, cell cycle sensor histidine kinase and response regulator CckA